MPSRQRLRIFISSPGDVKVAREIAAQTIERLAQDYARFFDIEPYLWEYEVMLASGHFQDSIEPPSAFDVVILILWSRLGTVLPARTALREYRGLDGRTPLTGTEWEFEEAFHSARNKGVPDLLVYRNLQPAPFDMSDPGRFQSQVEQFKALDTFWGRHFVNQGMFTGAYTTFLSDSEFSAALENHLRKLIQRRIDALGHVPGEKPTRVWARSPFRGLEAYEFIHAPIFFGQDQALARAMVQLIASADAGSPFLLVLGASGSGKSSLVKAGILPKLFVPRRIPGVAFLRRVVFRPSDVTADEDLFDALARRLTTKGDEGEGMPELLAHGQSPASLAAHLRHATSEPAYPIASTLGQLTIGARQAGRMLDHESARLALVVDQLEEMFANERIGTTDRRRFVALLVGLVRSGYVWVIATMRRDFWHLAEEAPELLELSAELGRLELIPPTLSQFSQMIRRPAHAAGIGFETDATTGIPLNEVIAEEVAREPGSLPLLSYLLDQLYRADVLEAEGSLCTYATYTKLGRLEGAIATQADAVFARCAPEDRQALGSVLFALIQSTTEGDVERVTARRIPLATFPAGTPQRRLVEALLDPSARLLVSDADRGQVPTVRVAHEALISRWAQARDFVRGNADALKVRRRLEERFALWNAVDPAADATTPASSASSERLASWRTRFGRQRGLLVDIDLADGRRLLETHRSDMEPALVGYVERSIADDRRIRKRSFHMLATITVIVSVLAIAALAAGRLATVKRREAEHQTAIARQAQLRSLTEAAASRLKEGNLPYARAIILEVLKQVDPSAPLDPGAVNVFQQVRANDRLSAILAGHRGQITGHPASVRTVAYSPEGNRIVTASLDGTARIWDARTGIQLSMLLRDPESGVNMATYSRDGARIITNGSDIKVWDAHTGALVRTLSAKDGPLGMGSLSPDGTRVAATLKNTVRIFDAATGAALGAFPDLGHEVIFTTYSPDGTRVLAAVADNTARILDSRSGKQLALLTGHAADVANAAFSPDGLRVITGSDDGTARVWDARSGARLLTLDPHVNNVWGVAFSPDGKTVATGTTDMMVRVWDAATGAELEKFTGSTKVLVAGVNYSPDGTHLASAGWDGTARIWNLQADTTAVTMAHDETGASITYSPDGARFIVQAGKSARVRDARSGTEIARLPDLAPDEGIAGYSHDSSRFLTTSGKTVRVRDARSGALLQVLTGPAEVMCAAFSLDGSRVIAAFGDQTVGIWDAVKGALVVNRPAHADYVATIEYSPDGKRILTGSFDGTARIWDANFGGQLAVLNQAEFMRSAHYSPDGKRVVTTSQEAAVRIWDAETTRPIVTMLGHERTGFDAVFSPDGTRVASVSGDRTARIWDARTGTQLGILAGHTDFVLSVAYSRDGAHIATSSRDGTARIWNAEPPADLPHQILWARAAEPDPLTPLQLEQLGLPPASHLGSSSKGASECDQKTAAFYDPERRAPGLDQASIDGDTAARACGATTPVDAMPAQVIYQSGRALAAKGDDNGAVLHFELALSKGYAAAGIDLARQLTRPNSPRFNPARAVSLYEQAWGRGVSMAAFDLGQLYEHGQPATATVKTSAFAADRVKAWAWYRRGAEAGEPNSLARFAERDEHSASELNATLQDKSLLAAFVWYARAAARAQLQAWPEYLWSTWRYRRASLARALGRDGRMKDVADAYASVLKESQAQ